MHPIQEKCMNSNCDIYHAQAKEIDAKYAANVCTVLASGMDYIWSHSASDILMLSPVGRKRKREGLHMDRGGVRQNYGMAGHQVGAS